MSFKTFKAEEIHPLAVKESLLAMVAGSVGTDAFKTLYRRTPEGLEDVIHDGDLACAFTTSSWLYLFNLIHQGVHTTVAATLQDLVISGWEECDTPAPARVVHWGERKGDDGISHMHIGICLDGEVAVSNYAPLKHPIKHPIYNFLTLQDGTNREVVGFYRLAWLERIK